MTLPILLYFQPTQGLTVAQVLAAAQSASLTEVVVMGKLANGSFYIKSTLDDFHAYFNS